MRARSERSNRGRADLNTILRQHRVVDAHIGHRDLAGVLYGKGVADLFAHISNVVAVEVVEFTLLVDRQTGSGVSRNDYCIRSAFHHTARWRDASCGCGVFDLSCIDVDLRRRIGTVECEGTAGSKRLGFLGDLHQRIVDRDVLQRNRAGVPDKEAVADRLAEIEQAITVAVVERAFLVDRQARHEIRRHQFSVGFTLDWRPGRWRAGGNRGVHHLPSINFFLNRCVIGMEGEGPTRCECLRSLNDRYLRIFNRDVLQGDLAGVLHEEGIGNRFPQIDESVAVLILKRTDLVDGKPRRPVRRHNRRIGRAFNWFAVRIITLGGCRVGYRAGIDIVLLRLIGRCECRGSAGGERLWSGRQGNARTRQHRIVHGDIGQRYVAGIAHNEGVGDGLTQIDEIVPIEIVKRARLFERQSSCTIRRHDSGIRIALDRASIRGRARGRCSVLHLSGVDFLRRRRIRSRRESEALTRRESLRAFYDRHL